MNQKNIILSRKIKSLFCFLLIVLLSLSCVISVSAVEKKSGNFNKKYTLTGNQAQDIITIARAQENKKKAQLGYKDAWCAAFVLDCARLSGISESIIPYNYAKGGSCTSLYSKLMKDCNAKVITAKDAKPGDLVFYYCSSCKAYIHVGFYNGNGYCLEGNVCGKVLKYNTSYEDKYGHSVKNGKIKRVYVHPNYVKSMVDCTVTLSKTSFTYTGKGNYTGTKTISFKIVPKQVTGVKLSVSKKKLTVKYSAVSGASGYQIAYRKKGTST